MTGFSVHRWDRPARRAGGAHARPAAWRRASSLATVAVLVLVWGAALPPMASAATAFNVFVGYMDTHTVGSSTKQPVPWPYTDPASFAGSPCPAYPNSTTCWDASAVRLDNPGSADVTGVHVVVLIGTRTYNLWASSLTVKAHGTLVLTETGAQNSTNFDGSDYPPNAYNGGNTASCANSGAIPSVQVTVGGATTSYADTGQVLNGGGVDKGHCVNGSFVSGRMDESHPWVQIGAAAPSAPSAPQSFSASAGSGSVTLTWAAPASNGGAAVTGYNVYRGTSAGGESATPIATGVQTTGFTDTAVANGTTYFYRAAAVNSAGTSGLSGEASATPQAVQATAPSAPRNLTGVPGSQSASLSWTAPTSDGGSPITGYNVYRGTSSGGESATPVAAGVTGTTFTDPALTNGTTYFYTVRAANAVGPSAQSNEISLTPAATPPSAPASLVASAGDGSVALAWTAPTSDGGAGVTGYDVYRGTTAGGEASAPIATAVQTTTLDDASAVNGTKYFYRVTAVNGVGASPPSNEASATPQAAATAPTAPRSLTAVAGNASAQLSWAAPSSNGGAAVTGYDVYRGTTAGGESAVPIATNVQATSFVDTGLSNGTAYFWTVVADNGAGSSPASSEASATPRASAPTAPLNLAASAGNASTQLSWSVPASTGGSPITGYNVYRGTAAGGEATTPVATNLQTTSFTDTSVVNGTTYYYRVSAVNAVGTSAQSNEVSATPQAPSTGAYVRRAGSLTASATRTSSVVSVGSPGVVGGDTLVVNLLLSSTTSVTGGVSAKDTAGNAYTVARDVNDGSAGDRLVTLVALRAQPLSAGSSLTLTYPSSAETHLSADEFSGVTGIDASAGATATGTSFSSGSTAPTRQAAEVVVGGVGTESGSTPAWSAGWTALPTLALSGDYLRAAYRVVAATGSYAATGTTGGQWMADVVTLTTG